MVALRLAKEGFGTIEQILAMPSDHVIDCLEYVTFLGDYETTFMELNKPQQP